MDETSLASEGVSQEGGAVPEDMLVSENEEGITFDARLLGEEPWARGRWGGRVGFLAPLMQTEGFEGAVAFGIFYQELGFRERNLIYEIGLDFSRVSSQSGYVESDLIVLRGDFLLAPWAGVGSRVSQYLALGVHGMAEIAHDRVTSGTYYIYEVGPTVGWGVSHARKGWDARVSALVLTGSGNAKVLLTTSASYAF